MYTVSPSEEQRIREGRFDDVHNPSLIRFLGYYGIENRAEASGNNAKAIELLEPVKRLLSAGYEYRPISKTWVEPGVPFVNLKLTEALGKLDAASADQEQVTPAEAPEPTAPEPQSGEPARAKKKPEAA